MFLQPRLSNKALCELCHRLAVEMDSGIDIRRTWQREADMARGRTQQDFRSIRDSINRGDSLATAIGRTDGLFPPLFHEMTDVGEHTGTLGRVYRRLETHYRRQVQAQRLFLGAIAWPMFELAFSILVVGALIWVLGIVAQRNNGQPIDILGFGLVGTRGLIIYTNFIVAVGLCVAGVVIAIKRGMLWTRPLQRGLMRLPVIGNALQRIALARLERRNGSPPHHSARAPHHWHGLLHPAHNSNRERRRARRPDSRRLLTRRRLPSRVCRCTIRRRGKRPNRGVDGAAFQPL
jgi:type II secretory pathway component PulF